MRTRRRMLDALLPGGSGGRSAAVFYGRLALCWACFLLGSFPILVGLGLLELDAPVEPLAIPFVLLFGGIFVALGVAAVWGPLRSLAAERGAGTRRELRVLVLERLRARIDRHSILGALSLAVLASGYWSAVVGGPGGAAGHLRPVLVLEFLTVHSFPFLVVATAFAFSAERAFVGVGGLLLLLMAAAYGAGAWIFAGGPVGLAWLAYLLVPNVLPFVGSGPTDHARAMAVSRWAVKFHLFMVVAGVLGEGDLTGPGAYVVGAGYFTVMVFVELFRLIDVPVDLARAWSGVDAGELAAHPAREAPSSTPTRGAP